MKQFLLALAIAAAALLLTRQYVNQSASDAATVDVPWMTDASAALRQAREQNKVAMLDFTGSDWCGWCKKLDREVFSTQAFADYSEENLVLLKLDFPRFKSQPEAEKQQNEALARQYGIRGFPTIVLLGPGRSEIGRMGYMPGGPEAWLAELRQITGT